MLDNKSAMIWAFEEMIDHNTYYDGNTRARGLRDIKRIINKIRTNIQTDDNIFNITECYDKVLKDNTYEFKNDAHIDNICSSPTYKYYLCGWAEHIITIFCKENDDHQTYNLGIINCGQGAEFQGHNDDLCNGIIIFKNIEYEKIYKFLNEYKNYYKYSSEFTGLQTYKSFYLLLFEKILDTDVVNFLSLRSNKNIVFYELPLQNIGSCAFTNIINIAYHLFVEANESSESSLKEYIKNLAGDYSIDNTNILHLYLQWYNKMKDYIKKVIYNEIIESPDKLKNYNIYKYILDTNKTPDTSNTPNTVLAAKLPYKTDSLPDTDLNNSNAITSKTYNYEIDSTTENVLYIQRYIDNPIYDFWPLYTNTETFSVTYNRVNTLPSYNHFDFLTAMFHFFNKISSFDNNMKALIPLLILYDFKKSLQNNNPDFWKIFNLSFLKTHLNYENTNKVSIENLIYTCICILLFKDDSSLSMNTNTGMFSTTLNSEEKQNNFEYYNFKIFQYIPIINNHYRNIVKMLISELYDNIGILPDINNDIHIKKFNDDANEFNFKMLSNNNTNTYLFKYLTDIFNKKSSKDILLSFIETRNLNFLLWFIFIYNINDAPFSNIYGSCFNFEVYGYIKYSDIPSTSSNIVISSSPNINTGKLPLPNSFILYDQIKKAVFENINNKLDAYTTSNLYLLLETLKLYIIYFYLCYLNKEPDKYVDKFKVYVIKYFKDIYYKPFNTIIDIYIYTHKLTISIEKKLFSIDEKTLIPSMEKKYFTLKVYEYTNSTTEPYLCDSITPFYKICTIDYNLLFYKNSKNTTQSIEIINILLQKYISIYLILNFWFIKDNNIIKGFHKSNADITITCDKNNKPEIYTENGDSYSIWSPDDLKHPQHIKFYKLMSHNDNGIFLYKNQDTDIYYLRTLRYDFIFTMVNNYIYITLNNSTYVVEWCNDEDTYNIYGILKLYKKENDIIDKHNSKIICIYNYDNIIQSINKNKNSENKYYIDKNFEPFKKLNMLDRIITNLSDEYKLYYYKIIDKFNGKYILTNISDVLALLINCLYYNSPFLILKNIENIKIILHNYYDKDIFNKLLNSLFLNFDNIYSLPILLLFYDNKKMNDFYYEKSNIIYDTYKILLKIRSTTFKDFIFNSLQVKNKTDTMKDVLYFQTTDININTYNIVVEGNIVKIHDMDTGTTIYINQERIIPDIPDDISDKSDSPDYSRPFGWGQSSTPDKSEIPVRRLIIPDIPDISDTPTRMLTLLQNNSSNDPRLFKTLAEILILKLDDDCFERNIIKGRELHTYLINKQRKSIHPIQEIVMGSGKSTVLTSYICILLLTTFFDNFKLDNVNKHQEIFIVIPESLINASFETLMKFVFPLFNNIEILIYPTRPLYTDSIHLYVITDTNYKIMFLEKKIETDYKYMIYDEVDMIANPLTCELNKPYSKKSLPNDSLFILAKKLYDNIFGKDNTFWDDIDEKCKTADYYYIFQINVDNLKKINDKFDKIFTERSPVIKYIRDNILIFLLTKQFNLDYGMPENYNLDTSHIYKFKAIPYSAVDSPIMGSEFSDPILTYILTLFCYKFVNNKYRKIDKNYILDYYSNIYSQNICNITDNLEIFNTLKGFFDENINFEYSHYKKNEEYYRTKYKDTFKINDKDFEIIIKKILEMNNLYYETCENISFNDLLLSKNVKNFICFTGTAYIKPPQGLSSHLNFNKKRFITRYETTPGITVNRAIENIIKNSMIMKNIYNNKSDGISLIDNIFKCIHLYDVLIDIGGVFINYNITKFIYEYTHADYYKTNIKESKKYIVYFDNGRKIYNLETEQFETNKVILQTEKKAFFFFSNKDITGIDVKDIMNSTVHALVVITNKTNMRDFSQGIFRMRRLLEEPNHETFDILFDNKFYNIVYPDSTKIEQDNNDCYYKINPNELKSRIINNLNKQQIIIDKQKILNLTKQNILGLSRPRTYRPTNIYLFIYPTNNLLHDINTKNILDIKTTETLILELITKYVHLLKTSNDVINFKINTTVEKETVNEKTKACNKQIMFMPCSRYRHFSGIVYSDFSFFKNNEPTHDNVLVLYKIDKDYNICTINRCDMVLVYFHTHNNLLIISTNQLIHFLMNNEDMHEYTFISLSDISIYGKNISNATKNTFLHKFSNIIEEHRSDFRDISQKLKIYNDLILYTNGCIITKPLKPEEKEKPINTLYQSFNVNIKSSYVINNQSYLIKYIKYKNKYLNLTKNNF